MSMKHVIISFSTAVFSLLFGLVAGILHASASAGLDDPFAGMVVVGWGAIYSAGLYLISRILAGYYFLEDSWFKNIIFSVGELVAIGIILGVLIFGRY